MIVIDSRSLCNDATNQACHADGRQKYAEDSPLRACEAACMDSLGEIRETSLIIKHKTRSPFFTMNLRSSMLRFFADPADSPCNSSDVSGIASTGSDSSAEPPCGNEKSK